MKNYCKSKDVIIEHHEWLHCGDCERICQTSIIIQCNTCGDAFICGKNCPNMRLLVIDKLRRQKLGRIML